jgi:hypothetical protein
MTGKAGGSRTSGTCALAATLSHRSEETAMAKPTEDQILQRAKALADKEGNNWNDEESYEKAEDGDAPPMTDSAERTDYLRRAAEELAREQDRGAL